MRRHVTDTCTTVVDRHKRRRVDPSDTNPTANTKTRTQGHDVDIKKRRYDLQDKRVDAQPVPTNDGVP